MEQKELELLRYAKDKLHFFSDTEQIRINEIGDGNLNYVYRLMSTTAGKSIIIKKSEERARISADFIIPVLRTEIESYYISFMRTEIGSYLPELLGVEASDGILAMEDLYDYKILRGEFMEFHRFPFLPEALADVLSKALLGTTVYCMEPSQREQMLEMQKENPLNEIITKTLVFEEPYNNCKHRNNVLKMNQEYVQNEIYQDERLWKRCSEYKEKCFSEKQALLHGDLHTGSIFIREDSFKFIDFEFSFWGPIGFDLGNLLANFLFAYERAHYLSTKESKEFERWMREAIITLYTKFAEKSHNILRNAIVSEEEADRFLSEIMHDTLVYAGIELIRRIVGMANVRDITTIETMEIRVEVERRLIQIAKQLVNEAKDYNDLMELMKHV